MGITTAQDGATRPGSIGLLRAMADAGDLPIDVVAYPLFTGVDIPLLNEIAADKGSKGRFRLGGIKLTLDGSIQGYTAYLSQPYYKQPGEDAIMDDQCCGTGNAERVFFGSAHAPHRAVERLASDDNNCGFPNMNPAEIDAWLTAGDTCSLQRNPRSHEWGCRNRTCSSNSIRRVRGDQPRKDLRTVIIHAQTIREDQLPNIAAQARPDCHLFFPIHVVFWGDRHRVDLFLDPTARSASARRNRRSIGA